MALRRPPGRCGMAGGVLRARARAAQFIFRLKTRASVENDLRRAGQNVPRGTFSQPLSAWGSNKTVPHEPKLRKQGVCKGCGPPFPQAGSRQLLTFNNVADQDCGPVADSRGHIPDRCRTGACQVVSRTATGSVGARQIKLRARAHAPHSSFWA